MTRKFLILLAVFLATAAFGAGSGGAAVGDPASGFLDFNPATGQMSYATSAKSIWPDGHDDVTVAIAYPGYYAIQPDDWQFGVAHSANVSKYCAFYADGWSCPASSLSIKTGKGNDTITIPYTVKLPTILEGGLGTDVIYGGGGPDVIWGGCSADPSCDTKTNSLHGGEGNDVVHGGAGNYDYVAGDAGDDVLDGGLGGVHDNLYGGDGRDTADYSSRTTPIVASLNGLADDGQPGENDFIASDVEAIQGGSGNDTLYANFFYSSVNILKGGPGNDSLIGYSGADLLMGEAGNDELRPGSGADNVYGGNGLDTVSYGERVNPLTVTLDGLANDGEGGETDNVMQDVEAVVGGSANDTLVGNANANVLTGGAGNDTLDGKGGQPDTLLGGPGNDRLDGGPAGSNADTLDGGGDTDMAYYASRSDDLLIQLGVKTGQEDAIVNVENAQGGSGNDTIVGTDGPNAFFGNGGNDAIQGNGGDDHLYGGAGNDTLWGNAGTDTIAGSIGDDTIDGGPGADWMSGWDGNDIVTYASYAVPVIVSLDGSANDGAAGEGDNVVPGVETVIGGQKGDTLTGDGFANWLVGGPGNDKLFGLGGDDVLDGQSGTDTVDGGTATDTCMAETKTGCEK